MCLWDNSCCSSVFDGVHASAVIWGFPALDGGYELAIDCGKFGLGDGEVGECFDEFIDSGYGRLEGGLPFGGAEPREGVDCGDDLEGEVEDGLDVVLLRGIEILEGVVEDVEEVVRYATETSGEVVPYETPVTYFQFHLALAFLFSCRRFS